MKDLGARRQRLAVFLALVTLLALLTLSGCQALDAQGSNSANGRLLVINPNLAFGTVVLGTHQVLTNTIVNTTFARITLTRATLSQGDFSLSGPELPMTLAPGQSASFSVTYTPHAAGSSNGTVFLASSATALSTSFNVSGTAVKPGTLSITPAPINLGSVRVGASQAQRATFANSGGTNLIITQATVTGSTFGLNGLNLPVTLAPNQSVSAMVSFKATSGGVQSGNISVQANIAMSVNQFDPGFRRFVPVSYASTTVSVPVSASGIASGQLAVTPASMSLGAVPVGSSQIQAGTLTNTGGSTVTVSQAAAAGTGFSVNGVSTPMSLAPGQSMNFAVKFAPAASGASSGSVMFTSDAVNGTLAVPLAGSGILPGSLSAGQTSLSFGNVQLNNSQTLQETLTNSGGSSVTISQATVTGAGFSVNGLSLPLTLAAGQSASFNVAFAPQASGAVTGYLAVTSNASNSLGVSLAGTGVTPGALSAGSSSLSFGNVQVNNSQTLQETLTNSGASSVTISQAGVSGAGFSLSELSLPLTLAAGQSASFNVAFTPQAGGSATGSISVASNAANSNLTISLSGSGITPGALAASSPSLSFGNVQVSNSQTLQETLTNSGGSSIAISQATVTGTGFSVSGLSLPLTLGAGQSVSFNVAFAPQAGGAVTGYLAVTSNASNSLGVSLAGTGVTPGALSAGSSSLSFGNVQVNNTQTLQETLTNSGGSSVTVNQATVTGTGFSVTGMTLPLTLTAGQSTSFNVAFTPQAGGPANGSISVVSTASNPNLTVSLAGSGVTAGSLSAGQSSLSFGNVQLNNSQTLQETLTNSGGSSVTVSQATVTGTGFSVSGLSLPLTLAAGQSASFNVAFAPQAGGAVTGSLAIVSTCLKFSGCLARRNWYYAGRSRSELLPL